MSIEDEQAKDRAHRVQDGTVRIIDATIEMVDACIKARLDRCEYMDSGPRAYQEAEKAIKAGLRDARGYAHRMRNQGNG